MYLYVIHMPEDMIAELKTAEFGHLSNEVNEFLECAKLMVRFSIQYIVRGFVDNQMMVAGFYSNHNANWVVYEELKKELSLERDDVQEFLFFPEELLWRQDVEDVILVADTAHLKIILREFKAFAVDPLPEVNEKKPGIYRILCSNENNMFSVQAVCLTPQKERR